jgi:hypothetical protein
VASNPADDDAATAAIDGVLAHRSQGSEQDDVAAIVGHAVA